MNLARLKKALKEGKYIPLAKRTGTDRQDCLDGMAFIRDRFSDRSIPGGNLTTDQNSRELMDHEHRRQRFWKERYGSCDRGCCSNNIVTLDERNNFRKVCMFTLSECPRQRLSNLIQAYSCINRPVLEVAG